MVQVTDKRGANHKPPTVEPPEVTEAAESAEALLEEQARKAAEDEAAEKGQAFPENTVFATCAFIVFQLPDGTWAADPNYGRPVAVEREANNSDMTGGCAAVQATLVADLAADMAAAKTLANFRAMGQQMAMERQAAQAAQEQQPNRAARRGRPRG